MSERPSKLQNRPAWHWLLIAPFTILLIPLLVILAGVSIPYFMVFPDRHPHPYDNLADLRFLDGIAG